MLLRDTESTPRFNMLNRPFSLAAEDISDLWNSGHQCIHARPEADIMLDYLKQFLYKFKSLPYFAFTFLTRLTNVAKCQRLHKFYLSGPHLKGLVLFL
jgi:hypothetical protein